ncbi:hypothetical protein SBBP1_800022 [Burkholderiales bacterium]|nr:hypothetical protein SBBP1_800022 [Burkholderiales bacterium]
MPGRLIISLAGLNLPDIVPAPRFDSWVQTD